MRTQILHPAKIPAAKSTLTALSVSQTHTLQVQLYSEKWTILKWHLFTQQACSLRAFRLIGLLWWPDIFKNLFLFAWQSKHNESGETRFDSSCIHSEDNPLKPHWLVWGCTSVTEGLIWRYWVAQEHLGTILEEFLLLELIHKKDRRKKHFEKNLTVSLLNF